jgi:hypothetical protein
MMWDGLVECENPNCKYPKALHHESSGNEVNWTACPKCRRFFDHGEEKQLADDEGFWHNVEEDTGYNKTMEGDNGKTKS